MLGRPRRRCWPQLSACSVRRRQRSLQETRIQISPIDLGIAIGIAALGATTQASVGFGFALIAAPMLLLIDADFVPGPLLASSLILTLLIAYRERRSIDTHGVAFALVGRASTTVPAALLVAVLPRPTFDILFAALVFVGVALSIRTPRFESTRLLIIAAGALSGFMGTFSSIGGPPMALLYQHADGPRIRSTLSAFFVVGSTLSIVALAAVGRFARHELWLAAALAPGVLLGFAASRVVSPWLDRGRIRLFVLALSLVSAVAVLGRKLV